MRILIVGGDAAGMSAASQIRRRQPDWQVTVLEKGDYTSYAACGIPYYPPPGAAGGSGDRLKRRRRRSNRPWRPFSRLHRGGCGLESQGGAVLDVTGKLSATKALSPTNAKF